MSNSLPQNRVLIMGILNVTPDSFSDGGKFFDTDVAVTHGKLMVEQGADIIDVGGESTRPGSQAVVGVDEELSRVIPVIEGLKAAEVPLISIDTFKPEVAREAIKAGAGMINDVSTLRHGDDLAVVAAELGAMMIIMHSRHTPADMQQSISYDDVVTDVARELGAAAEKALSVGVAREKIWLDPGIGFSKSARHNIQLMANLGEIVDLGYRVLVGPSRKSFISEYTGASVDNRMGGTAAAVTVSIMSGAVGIRVHDVGVMKQVALIAQEMRSVVRAGVEHG